VRAVIASSYSDIFSGNAFKNGIAAVVLEESAIQRLLDAAKSGQTVSVDLEEMEVTTEAGDRFGFDMDPFRRECLLGGLDEIGLTLASEAAITNYELRTGI
jgi:3-isopropylmalate/(R)-2-methylmalate dehydratase small subunit